jgi:hypothetical protein
MVVAPNVTAHAAEMLQWATLAGERRRFGLIVHHTDADREYTSAGLARTPVAARLWLRSPAARRLH